MLFKVIVCADNGHEVDYSIDLLRSEEAQSFIRGWQALQDAAQQGVHPTGGESAASQALSKFGANPAPEHFTSPPTSG